MMPPDSHTTALLWGEYFCPPPLVLSRNFKIELILQWRTRGVFFQLKRPSHETVPKCILKLESPEVSRKCTFNILIAIWSLWGYAGCQELQHAWHYLTQAQGPLLTYYRSHVEYCYILSVQLCCPATPSIFLSDSVALKSDRREKESKDLNHLLMKQ